MQHTKYSRQHVFGNEALQQSEPGHVDEREPESREPDQHECRRGLRPEPDHEDRGAPKDQGKTEREAQPSVSHQPDRKDPADQPTEAERGIQVTDSGRAESEQPDRRHGS